MHETPSPLYIFGYGSLCWKADFAYEDAFVGTVTGWKRVFAQLSCDHRGTPQAPGLVATLISDSDYTTAAAAAAAMPIEPPSAVTGVCYRVADEHAKEVLDGLDFRERGGYSRSVIEVSPAVVGGGGGSPVRALLYTATVENPNFSARYVVDVEGAAGIIARSVGPSGANSEYLFELHDWLVGVGARDAYLESLVSKTRAARVDL